MPYADVVITLPPETIQAIHDSVRALYQEAHTGCTEETYALVTGYDFHITSEGPRLIEINANAGGMFALLEHPLMSVAERARVKNMFLEACSKEIEKICTTPPTVAIVDERPEEQFLYPEFLAMAHLLEDAGYRVVVADTQSLVYEPGKGLLYDGAHIDAVYLRDTDFLLDTVRTQAIRAALDAGDVQVTPHPQEHRLLSDKEKLCTFSDTSVLPALRMTHENKGQLWTDRNKYVFKPVGGYASRGVYRGDKISHSRFEGLGSETPYIAQVRADAALVTVRTEEGSRVMKYDVRAYAHRERVYVLGARVYDGQVTNLRTAGGGFAPVVPESR